MRQTSPSIPIAALLVFALPMMLVVNHAFGQAVQSDLCEGLGSSCPISKTKSEIKSGNGFVRAVVRLECGECQGTGFFVSINDGLIITAHHVIKECLGKGQGRISVFSPYLSNDTLTAEVVQSLYESKVDAALLKITNERWNKLKDNFADVDISYRQLDDRFEYYKLGFPQHAYEVKPMDCKFQWNEGGLCILDHSVYPGDSGSPLFDIYGDVVAMCLKKKDLRTAVYLKTERFKSLLSNLTLDNTLVDLDKKILDGDITLEELSMKLDVNYRYKIRNTHLISWLRKIKTDEAAFPKYLDHLLPFEDCPIIYSLFYRGIPDGRLFPRAKNTDAIKKALGMADQMINKNMEEPARHILASTKSLIETEIQDRVNSHPKSLHGILKFSVGDKIPVASMRNLSIGYTGWLSANYFATTNQISGDVELSRLFRDHGVANIYLARITEDPVQKNKLLKESLSSLSLSVKAANDDKLKAANYAILGNAFLEARNFKKANSAYATAWSLGASTAWIKGNWEYINDKHTTYPTGTIETQLRTFHFDPYWK